MAAYTFTAANVLASTPAQLGAIAGEAIVAGDLIYIKAADSKAWKAQCDGTAAEAAVAGIALNGAAAGQPMQYVATGTITVQPACFANAGIPLVLDGTTGKCCPVGDLTTDDYVTHIGVSSDTDEFVLHIYAFGFKVTAGA